MQLEVEALKLYATIITNFGLTEQDRPKVISFASYIQK